MKSCAFIFIKSSVIFDNKALEHIIVHVIYKYKK